MIDDILLGLFTAGALAGALLMLVIRHPMRVALALVGTMLSLAGVYAMLGAHAVAVFQILIYVGAVMVFMVYVIMLLDIRDTSLTSRYSWLLVPAVVAFVALLMVLGGDVWTHIPKASATPTPIGVQPFSAAFLNDYWLYFELVSILLVAAIVAALAVIQVGRRHYLSAGPSRGHASPGSNPDHG